MDAGSPFCFPHADSGRIAVSERAVSWILRGGLSPSGGMKGGPFYILLRGRSGRGELKTSAVVFPGGGRVGMVQEREGSGGMPRDAIGTGKAPGGCPPWFPSGMESPIHCYLSQGRGIGGDVSVVNH